MLSVLRGSVLRSSARIKAAGALVAPSTVACRIKLAGSSTTSLTVTTRSSGVYYADIDTQGFTAGVYTVQWQGNGTYDCLSEETFLLVEPDITPA